MKIKKYKFITILENNPDLFIEGKTSYQIINNRNAKLLGMLTFYPEWDQYVFDSAPGIIYSKSCLLDIINFMEKEI